MSELSAPAPGNEIPWRGRNAAELNAKLAEADRLTRERNAATRELFAQIDVIDARFEEQIKAEMAAAAEQLVQLIDGTDVLDEDDPAVLPGDVSFGYWECTDSPTGRCAYDLENDPMRDHCLFCTDPSERK